MLPVFHQSRPWFRVDTLIRKCIKILVWEFSIISVHAFLSLMYDDDDSIKCVFYFLYSRRPSFHHPRHQWHLLPGRPSSGTLLAEGGHHADSGGDDHGWGVSRNEVLRQVLPSDSPEHHWPRVNLPPPLAHWYHSLKLPSLFLSSIDCLEQIDQQTRSPYPEGPCQPMPAGGAFGVSTSEV